MQNNVMQNKQTAAVGDTAAIETPVRRQWLRPDARPAALVLLATVALIVSMKLVNSDFGSLNQLTAILITSIVLVVASFGPGLVNLTGGIDL